MIELLVVVAVMPLVVGAITVGMLSVFSLQSSVSNRLTDSNDEQLVALNYQNDVQSAQLITTASNPASAPAPCGSGTQVLGLQLGNGTEVSYSAAPAATGTSYTLSRNVCSGGSETSSVVARDMPSSIVNPSAVQVTCSSSSTTCANVPPLNLPAYESDWQSTLGVTGVNFTTTEPGSKFNYTLVAVPLSASSSSQLAQVSNPTTGCGFATTGTGQYAQTLCFINFAPWNSGPPASPSPNCNAAQSGFSTPLPMSAALSNSPFTLDFCMSVKASLNSNGSPITGPTSAGAACGVAARSGYYDVTASPLPTYACPPGSEAFLGNNGFYTGVPNDPALYEVDQGSTAIINLTNISLLNANGGVASNWQLVTGDAESTDPGESITWTTNNNQVPLTLIPNSVDANGNVTSYVGNACNSVPPTYDSTHLTGVGTSTVTCTTANSTDKTGTVMLEALQPSSLTVTLVGTGLQAMFLGVLLP